jgi:large subunit ribosomal protein L17
MRRGKFRKFARETTQRKAMMKAMATALIDKERIKTTHAKAKTLSSFADQLVTKAKKGDLHARRLLLKEVGGQATDKLVKEIGPRYKDRNGGYTRVTRLGRRISDGSPVSIIEFIK